VSHSIRTERQTEMTKLKVTFCNFFKTHLQMYKIYTVITERILNVKC